ncbi:hypothetical protein GCM10020001_046130 [Nonomuraea salmonea]
MSQQRRGLGKGLGALIPTGPIVDGTGAAPAPANGSTEEMGPKPIAGAYFKEVALKAIVPNPRQPREIFDEERLEELAASIREVGLLQPIVVRSIGGGQYELIMGGAALAGVQAGRPGPGARHRAQHPGHRPLAGRADREPPA